MAHAVPACMYVQSTSSFGSFWLVSKQECLFRMFRFMSETPNQNEKLILSSRETNLKIPKHIKFQFFVCFEDTLPKNVRVKTAKAQVM